LEQGADFVFQTDSDGQTKAEEFAQFWELRNEYAMVIGHRNKREDGASRVFVTKTLKLVCFLLFHVKLTDANTPFRLMQAEELKKVLPLIPKDYNLSNVVISVIFAKKKLPVKYIPITFRPRQGGVNSINMNRIFKIGKKAVGDFIKINKMVNQACKETK
ncbi:MAG: glycosyltransferase family 2 protein, partial [Lachnospiraceae bacterium]|nr:glycosyltransferase family 2 protein [Lachnospiraceae bacterium]